MPYNKSNPPKRIKGLPKGAQAIWISAFNSAHKRGEDEETCNKIAWTAVKKKYKKVGDKWAKKASENMKKFREWTTAYINNLPDSAFAWIESGGEKDDEGKTKPRSLRHLPYKNKNGNVDLPHLRNALARLAQVKGLSRSKEKEIRNKLEKILEKKRSSEPLNALPFILSDLEVDGIDQIQIMPYGTWNHPQYGEIKVDDQTLADFKRNFEIGVRNDIPITEGHSGGGEEKPAVGWFKEIINKGRQGLWAVVEWTEKGKKLLKQNAYKYFSPEFYSTYEDPETQEEFNNVLVGGALTNRPYFKGLKPVAFSELTFDENMEEEKEQVEEEEEEIEEEPVEEEEEEEEEEPEEESEEMEGSERVLVNKKTLRVMERNATEGAKAMKEIRRMKAREFADEYQFSENNSKGVFLPKSRSKVESFVLSLDEGQKKAFEEILGEMPKGNLFSERGTGEEDKSDPNEKVNDLVRKEMSESDLGYRDALDLVLSENPELAKEVS